ncbi:ParB N-terminal domain-containing protein [Acidisoma sp. 7E03]
MRAIKVELIKVADITWSEARIRRADRQHVEALATSMDDQGLLTPIIVRKLKGNLLQGVAGFNRWNAAQLLGWETIPAEIVTLSDDKARIVEIEENFRHLSLTILGRAICLEELKALYLKAFPETKWGGIRGLDQDASVASGSDEDDIDQTERDAVWSSMEESAALIGARPKSFATKISEEMGVTDRAIRAWVKLAAALSPDARSLLEGTTIADNRKELEWIGTQIPRDQQAQVIQEAFDAGKLPSAMRAEAEAETTVQNAAWVRESHALSKKFEKVSKDARLAFLDFLVQEGWIKKGSILRKDAA